MGPGAKPMELLYQIAHAINASLDLEDTLQAILGSLQQTLGVRVIVIRLLSPDAKSLEVAASIGVSQASLDRVSSTIVPGSLHARVLAGETLHLTGLSSWRSDLPPDLPELEGVTDLLAVPMQVRGRAVGTLRVYCGSECQFTSETVVLMQAVGDLAAIAIENARLHTTLFSIAHALNSSLELQPMLQTVLTSTVHQMALKGASIRLLEDGGRQLDLVAAHGLSEQYLSKGPIIVSASPVDQRVLAGETVVIQNVAEETGFQYPAEAQAEGIRSVLAVPLDLHGRVIGVMRVYSARARPFSAVGMRFLQSVAGLVAVAIVNARLHAALRERYEGLKDDVSEWYRFLTLG